jgi:putative redox protein
MHVISSWQGGYRCRTAVRDFEIRVDEPIDKGGTDTGPMPTELLVASLSSCVALAVAFVARRRGIALPDVVVRADADYDGPRVARIGVEVESRHDREELASVLEEAVPLSWVANSLRGGPQLSFGIATDVTHQTPPARPER